MGANNNWETVLADGVRLFIDHLREKDKLGPPLGNEHFNETPNRVVRSLKEFTLGVGKSAASVLGEGFAGDYNEMVVVRGIDYVSLCAHHLLPFVGEVHFGYLPNGRIVGLSKIPRMVEVLAARPQVQEALTQNIVEQFQGLVEPMGCGVVVTGMHTCTTCRGVRKAGVVMKTQGLRGEFLEPEVKSEFLEAIR